MKIELRNNQVLSAIRGTCGDDILIIEPLKTARSHVVCLKLYNIKDGKTKVKEYYCNLNMPIGSDGRICEK